MKVSNVNIAHPVTIFHGYSIPGRAYLEALFFNIGLLLTIFLATLTLSVSLSFAAGGVITPFHVPFAAGLTATIAYFIGRRERIRYSQVSITLAIVILFLLIVTFVGSVFYDLSWDGQAIHQEAILQLAGGWNPFYDRLDDSIQHAIWIMHYPKGSWLQAAAIYDFTGSIESGKATNIILIVISWLFVSSLLINIKSIPVWAALVIATIAALNPVSVYQALTFYIDGQLSSLFISLFALLVKAMQRPDKYILASLCALALLLMNTKFNGLVYALILITASSGADLYLNGWKAALKSTGILTVGVMIGVLLVGFNPYITNTLERGNPLYPLFGEGAIDVVTHAKPKPLQSMNRLEALATSVFNVSSYSHDITLKPPFKLPDRKEIWTFAGWDMRLGGWGPWFGGMLILAAPIVVIVFTRCKRPKHKLLLVFLLATLAMTVIINPEAWWARYAPQLFMIPLVAYIIYFSCFSGFHRIFGVLALLVAIANLAMIALPQAVGNLRGTIAIKDQLSAIRESALPLVVYFSLFDADRARLNEAGIDYSTVLNEHELPCEEPVTLVKSHKKVKFCAMQ